MFGSTRYLASTAGRSLDSIRSRMKSSIYWPGGASPVSGSSAFGSAVPRHRQSSASPETQRPSPQPMLSTTTRLRPISGERMLFSSSRIEPDSEESFWQVIWYPTTQASTRSGSWSIPSGLYSSITHRFPAIGSLVPTSPGMTVSVSTLKTGTGIRPMPP